ESDVSRGRQTFDLAQASGAQGAAVPAQAPAPAQKPQKVSAKSLRAASQEALALRQQVWDGALAPDQFYPAVQQAFERRFGADYGPKVSAFLDQEAARASKPRAAAFDRMTPAQRQKFFQAMPKGAELHLHLTGAVPGDKILDIGEQLGTKLPVA